jgi:ABC-type multidrug transport system permease subunit
MVVLSGLFFPIEQLPLPLRIFANGLPTTHGVSLMLGVWDGSGWGAHLGSVATLILIFLVCMGLTARIFCWE